MTLHHQLYCSIYSLSICSFCKQHALFFYVYSKINYSFNEKSIASFYQPSVTTDEIDKAVHKMIIDAGAYPSPLGYGGFPKSVCTSVNECMCHGIPDSRELQVQKESSSFDMFCAYFRAFPQLHSDISFLSSLFYRMEI